MRVGTLVLLLVCTLLPARGETIYAATVTGDILAVDSESLSSILVAHTRKCWYDIALVSDGRLYGSDGYRLYEINPLSGGYKLIGMFGGLEISINAMTFVGDTLYGSGMSELYTIDLATGGAQLVGSTGYLSSGDLQWFREALYMTAIGGPADRLLRVDLASGQATMVGWIGFERVYGLAATSTGLFGLTEGGDLLEIDATTGAGTRLGPAGGAVYGATSRPSGGEIPEPSALLLLGTGLTLAATRLRRR